MSGWKTWAAGIGMILAGLGQVGMALGGGDGDMNSGVQTILAGLAIIGIGHKVEKAAK